MVRVGILSCLLLLFVESTAGSTVTETPAQHGFSALVFSRTTGFRHDAIPAGIAAIQSLASEHDFEVTATEDPAVFTDQGLADYDVVIFLNTTGDVLDADQQAAFERFIASGKGYVGVHSAADTEYDWEWYGGLVGAWFQSHPAIQTATVRVLDRLHPSTEALPLEWERTDEWYDYRASPRGDVHVLATLDADSYNDNVMGTDHPIAWCRAYEGGRTWYTGMGHTQASYSEDGFRAHLLGGIEWAAGVVGGDCSATIGASFDHEVLEGQVDSPMDLAVLPDGSVLFLEIGGAVKHYVPETSTTSTVNQIDVFQDNEDGLLGIVLDPSFESNSWIYLFYSPSGPVEKQHVSRFTWTGTELDAASEVVLLEIPTQRAECCHSSGSMAFDPDGHLLIGTGDNVNPFASDGYAPIDERAGRAAWDAQGTSGNTDDLRGKIIRITPQPDGSYTIPAGNLFEGTSDGLPEIYAMGVRNPFRISVDPARGWLYWGDVGPDARGDNATLGPKGYDEWNQAREAGNYGWPFCAGPNIPYGDRDFASGATSGFFDCAAPVNDSPNNTGATTLPAARSAWIYYPYDTAVAFPGIPDGSGRTAMAGPVYQYQAGRPGEVGLPEYYHDRLIIYEWSRNYVLVVTLDDDGSPLSIDPLPGERSLFQPISMKQGPDGALYVLEWGTGFGTGNPDARLSRITFTGGARKPVAVIDADPVSGPIPLEVSFSAASSFDPDGDPLTYAWDLDGDGITDATSSEATWTYTDSGDYLARLSVSDPGGNITQSTVTITAGNTRPQMELVFPADRAFADWGETVPFRLSVTDAEDGSTDDGSIDCALVDVQLYIGHNAHTHPLGSTSGCEGSVQLPDGHGDDGDELFHVIEFRYTDAGAGNAAPITVLVERVLRPGRLEAEHFDTQSGIQTETTADPLGGGDNIGWIDHGDWVAFDDVNLAGIEFVNLRVASAGTGGRIDLHRESLAGHRIGRAYVASTGGWQTWRDITIPISDPVGSGPLYLLFENNQGDSGLLNVNYLEFTGPGASARPSGSVGFDAEHLVGGGSRRLARVEPQIAFDWSNQAPLIGATSFTSTWEGRLVPPEDGSYILTLQVQGTVDVMVDGVSRVSLDSPGSVRESSSVGISLEAGVPVPVTVTYESGSGRSAIWVDIRGPGLSRQPLGGSLVVPATYVSDEPAPAVPSEFQVTEAYPNPTSDWVDLAFDLPTAGPMDLEVYDVLGRLVKRSRMEGVGPGRESARLGLSEVAAGVYYVVIRTATSRTSISIIKSD